MKSPQPSISTLQPELSLALIKMAVKIKKPVSVCTLQEVRKLKDALAEKASLHSYGMYIESMSESSVVLVLQFPESCVGWIVAALTCEFLQELTSTDRRDCQWKEAHYCSGTSMEAGKHVHNTTASG